MFSHYDRHGKCEWFQGGLNEFVSHYNSQRGTVYVLTECLDVKAFGSATPKQPEVLVTDNLSGKRMVIERKSVVWPTNYIRNEQVFHTFSDVVYEAVGNRFRDGLYELRVRSAELDALDPRSATAIAKNIGSALGQIARADIPLSRSEPIRWSFCRASTYEDEGRIGICVISDGEPMGVEDFDPESAIAGTARVLQDRLDEASAKFMAHLDKRRIVLLDFFGDTLEDEDIPPMIQTLTVPASIDEVWMTTKVWISPDDFEVDYERIFERSV